MSSIVPARKNNRNTDIYPEAYQAPDKNKEEEKEFYGNIPPELHSTVKGVIDRKVKLRVK